MANERREQPNTLVGVGVNSPDQNSRTSAAINFPQLRTLPFGLTGLTWTIPASRAKNGVSHVVPLSAPVQALLRGFQLVQKIVFVHGIRPS